MCFSGRWLLWWAMVSAAITCSAADERIARESELQAALTYNFAIFAEWPGLPSDKFHFCIYGNEGVTEAMLSQGMKPIKGIEIVVRKLSNLSETNNCQVIFVESSKHWQIAALSRHLGNSPVMVIAEEDEFNPQQVTIVLAMVDGRYTFKINQTAAQAHSLRLSSKLLKLATRVY